MDYSKYDDVLFSSDALSFKFVSSGVKGDMEKVIDFTPFPDNDEVYNLGLSTLKENGEKDFLTESKNGDRDKILGTIGRSAYTFSEANPNKIIYLSGNSAAKTRLYRMAINKAYEEICKTFIIYGLTQVQNKLVRSPFLKDQDYFAFLFKRKDAED